MLYGPIALVLGSRPTGLGGMVQEPRARFKVVEWGGVLSLDGDAKSLGRSEVVLSASAFSTLAQLRSEPRS